MTELERELREVLAEWVALFKPVIPPDAERADLLARSEAALVSARRCFEEEQ